MLRGVGRRGRVGVDAALAPGSAQRGSDPSLRQFPGRGWGWCDRQHRAGFNRGQVAGGLAGEGLEERWVVLAQQRAPGTCYPLIRGTGQVWESGSMDRQTQVAASHSK